MLPGLKKLGQCKLAWSHNICQDDVKVTKVTRGKKVVIDLPED